MFIGWFGNIFLKSLNKNNFHENEFENYFCKMAIWFSQPPGYALTLNEYEYASEVFSASTIFPVFNSGAGDLELN